MSSRRLLSENLQGADVIGALPTKEYGVRASNSKGLYDALVSSLEAVERAIDSEEILETGFTWPNLTSAIVHLRDEHSSGAEGFITCPGLHSLLTNFENIFEGIPSEMFPEKEISAVKTTWERCKATYAITPNVVETFTVPIEGAQKDVDAVMADLRKATVRILRRWQRKLGKEYLYQEKKSCGVRIMSREDHDPDRVTMAGEVSAVEK